jgi:NDP-sugar pyrophosphorylase family protein
VNAVKAMILHTDEELRVFKRNEEYFDFLLNHPEDMRIVLAAGYNANVSKIYHIIQECGSSWRDISCGRMFSETRVYLLKYDWIYGLLFNKESRIATEKALITEESYL